MKKRKEFDLKIAIVGGDEQSLEIIDKEIISFMEKNGIYIFDVLLGAVGKGEPQETLGKKWAAHRGMPVTWLRAHTKDKLERRLFYEADYIFFVLNDEQWIKNMIMKYKMTGKHGSVVFTPYRAAGSLSPQPPTLHCAADVALPRFLPVDKEEVIPW